MPSFYGDVDVPRATDPQLVVLQKILGATIAGGGGGGGTGSAGSAGAGSPEGAVVGAVGDTYYDTTNLVFWYKTSGAGNVGWTPVV